MAIQHTPADGSTVLLDSLFDLTNVCPACGTGHLRTGGNFGRCRKCEFPIGVSEPDYIKRRLALVSKGAR